MKTVFDVAKYILDQSGEMTAMKLQKLVYYSQVWHVVWEEEELFKEEIQAWANGAVVSDLFAAHRRMLKVNSGSFPSGNSDNLITKEKENIDKVIGFYGKYNAQQLSDINHSEQPWIDAREGLSPTQRSNNPIDLASILEYYSGLPNDGETK